MEITAKDLKPTNVTLILLKLEMLTMKLSKMVRREADISNSQNNY